MSYDFVAPCQNFLKTNDNSKKTSKQKKGRTEGQIDPISLDHSN